MFDLTVRLLLLLNSCAAQRAYISLDIQGKAKYNAWQKVADSGMKPEEAQQKYVKLVNSLKEKYGFEG